MTALTAAAVKKAKPYSITSSRMAGPPFFVDGTSVRNNYQLRLINKRNQEATFVVTIKKAPEGFELGGAGQEIKVASHDQVTRPTIIFVPYEHYEGPCEVTLQVTGQPGDVTFTHSIDFVGPNPASLKKK